MSSAQIFLVSVDPASSALFKAEVHDQSDAEIVESLDEHRLLLRCEPGFRALFALHRFPVRAEQTLGDLDFETVRPFVWGGLPLERLSDAAYALQLSANLRLPWSFSEMVETLIADLGLSPAKFQPRDPQVVLSAFFHLHADRCRVFAGISSPKENLSPWASGHCRIPRDANSVSRAEGKLLEAWEAFAMPTARPGARALDLGAAPGGWSRVLAGKGYLVDAVDPASLDPEVGKLGNVRHHVDTAGSFLARDKARYDLIVSDMKMEAGRAADLLVNCAQRLTAGKGRLLTTLKLGKGPAALPEARRALARLATGYTVLQARQLYFNRSEITVLAQAL